MARKKSQSQRVDFLFVNKNISSTSLSHSKEGEENGKIQSHVQARYRQLHQRPKTVKSKKLEIPRLRRDRPGDKSHSQEEYHSIAVVPQDQSPNSSDEVESHVMSKQSSYTIPDSPDPSNIDVFEVMSFPIDTETNRLLQYPFSSYVETETQSESLALVTTNGSPGCMRHRDWVMDMLRRCSTDNLTLNATLSFASSCLKWTVNENDSTRPPEAYNVKTVQTLRRALAKTFSVDSWLLWSIGALVACELWSGNLLAAEMHLKMAKHFLDISGGTSHFDSFVVETLILKDKYLAIRRCTPQILSLDFDPGPLPGDKWLRIQCELPTELFIMGQGFLASSEPMKCSSLSSIIHDLIDCVQIAHSTDWSCNRKDFDVSLERWLFLRQNALFHRILGLKVIQGELECCRIALLMWLLKVTPSLTARRALRSLVPRLLQVMSKYSPEEAQSSRPVLLWVLSVGSMSAEFMEERAWFVQRAAHVADQLCVPLEKEPFRNFLRQFLFLHSEDGLQFFRFIQVMKEVSRKPTDQSQFAKL